MKADTRSLPFSGQRALRLNIFDRLLYFRLRPLARNCKYCQEMTGSGFACEFDHDARLAHYRKARSREKRIVMKARPLTSLFLVGLCITSNAEDTTESAFTFDHIALSIEDTARSGTF